MKTFFAILLCLCGATLSAAPARADCARTALEVTPELSAEARRDFETKLERAREEFGQTPDAERFIWLGRRTAST